MQDNQVLGCALPLEKGPLCNWEAGSEATRSLETCPPQIPLFFADPQFLQNKAVELIKVLSSSKLQTLFLIFFSFPFLPLCLILSLLYLCLLSSFLPNLKTVSYIFLTLPATNFLFIYFALYFLSVILPVLSSTVFSFCLCTLGYFFPCPVSQFLFLPLDGLRDFWRLTQLGPSSAYFCMWWERG